MSGHSKWSTIKSQKGVADAKKGKLFTKLGQAITLAARQGGGDPASNSSLRLAIDKAKQFNMPKDNIERAIARGIGVGGAVNLEEIVYEAYGPGGVAFIISCITDNRNRTASEVKHILTKYGGRLAESNSVRWQFKAKAVIQLAAPQGQERESLELGLIELGIDDLREEGGQLIIYTPPSDLERIKQFIESRGFPIVYTAIELVSDNPIDISDGTIQRQLDQLKEELDNLDEVDNIFTNEK